MFNGRRNYGDAPALILLIALGVLFFFDVLFSGKVFFAGDNLTINVPGKVLFWRMLFNGQLPLWNPFTFSGTPFLADVNLGLLSPFTLFYLFLPPLRALTFSIVTGVIFAGITMYLYARVLRISRWGSLLSASIFMFSGSLMTHTMNTAILNSVVWLPLLFMMLENLYRKKEVRYTLYSSIILAFIIFGGHIQYFYYTLIAVFFYILSKPLTLNEKIVHVLYVILPALFLSAVQLIPFLEYAGYSTRPVQNLAYSAGSASIVSFIHLLLPNFFGVMKDGTSWGATSDINGYVGIIPLFLAALALLKKRGRTVLFFAIAALVSLTIALGRYSPVYLAAFYILPFFSRFRSPASILIIYTFSVAVLAGYGADYLFESAKNAGGRLMRLVPAGLLTASVFLIIAAYLKIKSGILLYAIITLNLIKKTAFFTRFLEYSSARMNTIFELWTENVMILSLFLVMLFLFVYVTKKKQCITPLWKLLFALLVISDLFLFAGNNYIVTDESNLKTPVEIARFFEKDKSVYRVLTLMDPGAKPPFADPGYFNHEAVKALDFIQPNTNILVGREIVGGYASIVPASYSAYLSPTRIQDPTSVALPKPGLVQLDELGVKYLITAGRYEKELMKTEKYKKTFEYNDNRINRTFSIFENTAYFPRAFTLNSDNEREGKAIITRYTPNRVDVYAEMPYDGRIVVSSLNFPGWKAYENGRETIMETYKIFQSVPVTEGAHRIVLKYEPVSFMVGAAISVVNWIYMSGFFVYLAVKKHKQVREELHVGKP